MRCGRRGVSRCAPPLPSAPRSRLGRWDGAGAAVPGMGSGGHVCGSRERQGPARWGWLVARRSGVLQGAADSPVPSSRWLQRRESLWSYWCLSFHIWRTELRGRGEFPIASRSGEGVDAGRAVGRGVLGPGSILAPHLNLFVNAHTHRDSAKQAVHSVEHKWSLGNYCRDKPGAVSSKNSRVCVLVERSVCLHPPGRRLVRAHRARNHQATLVLLRETCVF